MADDGYQKEPPKAESRPPSEDDNRLPHPDSEPNYMALTAFWLGMFSFIPPIICATVPAWGQDLPVSSRVPVGVLCVCLELLLGLAALIFGVMGVRYSNRHPIAGGRGYAIFGIVFGILTSAVGLFLSYLLMLVSAVGAGAWK